MYTPGESKKARRLKLLFPEYTSDDVLRYLIAKLACSIILRIFLG